MSFFYKLQISFIHFFFSFISLVCVYLGVSVQCLFTQKKISFQKTKRQQNFRKLLNLVFLLKANSKLVEILLSLVFFKKFSSICLFLVMWCAYVFIYPVFEIIIHSFFKLFCKTEKIFFKKSRNQRLFNGSNYLRKHYDTKFKKNRQMVCLI